MQLCSKSPLGGVFKTCGDLDAYEKQWHMEVYQSTWSECFNKVQHMHACMHVATAFLVRIQFTECCDQNQSKLFTEIR